MKKTKRLWIVTVLTVIIIMLMPCGLVKATTTKTVTDAYEMLPSGEIPKALRGRKLTNQQIKSLDLTNPAQLKKKLSTLEDVIAWFNLLEYQWIDGGMRCNSPTLHYEYFQTPSEMIYSEFNYDYTGNYMHFGTDCLSLITAWLLEDDFKDVGVLMTMTQQYVGQSYAYFYVDGAYYLLGIPTLIDSSRINFFVDSNFDSVKTSSKASFATIANDTAQFLTSQGFQSSKRTWKADIDIEDCKEVSWQGCN